MASVASDLARRGFPVTGSDSQFYPPMSDILAHSQVGLCVGFAPQNLPPDGLVIVGNAISRGNPELEAALNLGLNLISLPELIRHIYLTNRRPVVVAGTHGKTTTTAMVAYILRQAGLEPGWMIGGEPIDLPSPCELGIGQHFVIEGDEYDSVWYDKRPKFLNYRPFTAIINAVEFDHADIYPDIETISLAFRRFVALLPGDGLILVRGDDQLACDVTSKARCRVETFGFGEGLDWRIEDRTSDGEDGSYGVVSGVDGIRFDLKMLMAGKHNLANGCAAVVMAIRLGVDPIVAAEAMSRFQGVKRRLELAYNEHGIVIYDDFAHHPTAIQTTLQTLRRLHPKRRLWALFEPRSNTMVRNYLQDQLIEALAIADRVVLGPLHRKENIPETSRLNTDTICKLLDEFGVRCTVLKDLEDDVRRILPEFIAGDVVVIMTNGKFGNIKEQLISHLNG